MKVGYLWMAAILFFLAPPFADAAPQVEVYNYEGRTSVLRNGRTIPPDLDLPCQEGDVLRVEDDSTLDLSLNFLMAIRFFGPAVCTLSNLEPSNTYLKMDSGTAMLNMKTLPSDATFELETPTIVASSKNAKFLVQITKNPGHLATTAVTVKSGTISAYVKESSSAITVLEGQHLEIAEGSFIPSARSAKEEELKPLERVLSVYIVEPPENS